MAIPIHQILFDGRAPRVNRRCLSSWAELRPDFEIRVWGNEDIRSFISSASPLVRELLTKARNFGEASDTLRIAIVHEFGGIYTDWDIYLLNPQQFVERFSVFKEIGALFLRDSRTSDPDFSAIITHSFFYSDPRRQILQSFLERTSDNYKKNPSAKTIHINGPQAFTRFLLDDRWNLDAPPFVEQDQFFRHDYKIAAAQNDKMYFLDTAIKSPGAAPLLNLWTNSWIEKSSIKLKLKKLPILRSWLSDPFRASMKQILSR